MKNPDELVPMEPHLKYQDIHAPLRRGVFIGKFPNFKIRFEVDTRLWRSIERSKLIRTHRFAHQCGSFTQYNSRLYFQPAFFY